MQCPLQENGVHQMGAGTVCQCGYVLSIPRFMFSLEVFDNETQKDLSSESFNCSHVETVVETLRRTADALEKQARGRSDG